MSSRRFEWTAVAVALIAVSAFAWIAWGLARGDLIAFDESTRAAMHSYAGPALTLLMRAVTFMGTQLVILGATAGVAAFLHLKGNRDTAWLILIAVVGADLLEVVLKLQFHRQRPEPFFDTVLPGSYSFPSGHALLSLCTYGLIAWVIGERLPVAARWMIRIAALLLILATGASRVYLGVHHTTDVIGGYLVAIAWTAAVLAVHRRIRTMKT